MNDQDLMENLLLLEKGACDLFLHGTIEASTGNVHQVFDSALSESLCMQDTIYGKMAAKGWYSADTAPQNQVTQLKQKFIGQ